MRKVLLSWVFLSKNYSWGLEGLCDRWVSYACPRVTQITVWVVSKNEWNCRLENKMVSTVIWRRVRSCSLVSQTCYGLLFSDLTITHVTSYAQLKFPVSFLLYIATEKTCQINPIITVNSSMNASISETSQKKTPARLACLCFFFCSTLCTSNFAAGWKECIKSQFILYSDFCEVTIKWATAR